MTQFTKRERVLIVLLACIASGAIMYMLFLGPQLRTRGDNKLLYDTLTEQKAKAEENITKAEQSKVEIKKLAKEAQKLYTLMTQTKSYDVSLLLSDMLARHGLTPVSLQFTDYEAAEPPGNTADEDQSFSDYADQRSKEYNGLDQVPQDEETNKETDDNADEEDKQLMDYALKRTASLQVSGAQGNVDAFLDELTDYNISYLISGYTYAKDIEGVQYEIRLEMYEFVQPEVWKAVQEGEAK